MSGMLFTICILPTVSATTHLKRTSRRPKLGPPAMPARSYYPWAPPSASGRPSLTKDKFVSRHGRTAPTGAVDGTEPKTPAEEPRG